MKRCIKALYANQNKTEIERANKSYALIETKGDSTKTYVVDGESRLEAVLNANEALKSYSDKAHVSGVYPIR